MKLPKTISELTEIFLNSTAPDIFEFDGEYYVDMLTNFPSFKRFSHQKVFYPENDKVMGYNVLFGKKWGYFLLQEGVCEEMGSYKAALINYDRQENTFFTRRIRDYVRCFERDTLYIGRFYYLFFGRLYFLGYFSLEKIK